MNHCTELKIRVSVVRFDVQEARDLETDSWAPIDRSPERTYMREQPKISRNEPCPCGSGKKYKKCCVLQQH
jgi:uncharacterized protein YecA (UPF0149 family)